MKQFVILNADRTGSNLLVSLLRSHRDVGVGGELFNLKLQDHPVPWEPVADDVSLIQLRRENPARFLDYLFSTAAAKGLGAWGFKLHYQHAWNNPDVLKYLRDNEDILVVHLRRRNRLRRYLSNARARRDGRWYSSRFRAPIAPTAIELSIDDCVADFLKIARNEAKVVATFSDHEIVDIWYEELELEPAPVANRVIAALGLAKAELTSTSRKMATDPISVAISNYQELKTFFGDCASYFEE